MVLRELRYPNVTSMAAPVASGWSGCRVGLAPTGERRLVTAHTQCGHCPNCGRRKRNHLVFAQRSRSGAISGGASWWLDRRRAVLHCAFDHLPQVGRVLMLVAGDHRRGEMKAALAVPRQR